MTTSTITHHRPVPYAVVAGAVAALVALAVVLLLVGPLSLPGSGSDQPALNEAPGYGAYPPGGQHPAYQHHPTTAGGRIVIGQ
jgi:hypothetical protein